MTFWEHLDELRGRLWRIVVAATIATIVCFCFKDLLFAIVLHPKPEGLRLINTELAQQFMIHIRVSVWLGVLVVMPYVLYQIFAFVAPGLYEVERRVAIKAVGGGYALFMLGVALCYWVIFPFTVRFLADYSVSEEIRNAITLESYVSMMGILCLVMGVIFELPILCWMLAKIGILKAQYMREYRRHAIVIILIVGAIITPTGDPFTLMMVSVPIYLLWEMSIMIVKKVEKR